MSVRVRPAATADAPAIRRVHLAAFPTPAEADLVDRLEDEGDAMISLVAEADGQVVGHILMSRMDVQGEGRSWRALALAPVAVLPARQGGGIGSALIRAALERSRSEGTELVFVLGDPAYYRRFGFAAATAAPFASPYAGEHFLALALRGVELPSHAEARYAAAFEGLG